MSDGIKENNTSGNIFNKENQIKESRTNEATVLGYIGTEGKFAVIARNLGQPIFTHGTCSNSLFDPYEVDDEQEIPTLNEEQNSFQIGVQFDGLSRGINMTIYMQEDLNEITCRFQGKIVYREVSGELEGYAPDPIWEEKIESLYAAASKIEKKRKPLERAKILASNHKKKLEIFEYLKNKWGIK